MAVALLALWVSRLSGQPSFSAGFIFMRRTGSAALCAAGPVINVLPMEMHLEPQATLYEAAARISRELKTVRRHQRYDAEQVQRDLGRIGDGEPLYGTVFNFKMFDYQLDFAGIEGITHDLASGPVRDLEIALFIDEHHQLKVELLANAERYSRQELQAHLQRLPLLLAQFAAQAALPIGEADMLTADDHALLARVNDTAHPVPATTLSQLLAQQAQTTPDAPALADAHFSFTYRETREQVTALARELVALGVRPGDIVAVALPRSVFLSLALMAIVEAGAAYLPLDTGYPDERLAMMLEDAAPRLVITNPAQQARFADKGEILLYDAPLAADHAAGVAIAGPTPDHAAYIIFTSGSTGRPKGVLVGHQAIVNRLLWMQHQYPLGADDAVLQKTPCSFDVSVWEFFWPLMVGARLVMAPPEAHRDPQQLQQLIAQHRITTLHFVPSMLAAFVAALDDDAAVASCAALRQVFCSGEALPAELCRLWQSRTAVPLHNLYGPTEAAVDVTWHPAYGEALAKVTGANVPIGLPVWNTGLRILDARLRPVPPGVAGDLYLTGVQLAHGYLGRPDLTASRFVADPFGEGGRMYRTGDVARWLPDGAVEYLGRSDDQLKIRGQRIELSEIDHALLSLPGVRLAVTHALVLQGTPVDAGGDARQLVGYLVMQPGANWDAEALRAALADRLPPHMVPVALVEMSDLPLSANGKLDRKALPQPQGGERKAGRPPQAGLESEIAAVFARLLQREQVFADDDFFALGGHSLLAMRLAAELRRDLGKAVSVGQVMVASRVEQLAALLAEDRTQEEADRSGFDSVLPLRVTEGPTLFCLHPASGFSWQFSVLPRYLDQHWSLVGIQSPRPDGAGAERRYGSGGGCPPADGVAGTAARAVPLHRLLAGRHAGAGHRRPAAGARRAGGVPRPAGYLSAGDPKLGRDAGRQRVEGSAARARAVPGGVAGYARSGAGRDAHGDVRQHRSQLRRFGAVAVAHAYRPLPRPGDAVRRQTHAAGRDGRAADLVAVRRCAAGARAGLRACRYRFAGVVQSAGAAAEPDLAHAVIAPVISPPGTGNYPRVAAFLAVAHN